MINVQRLTVNDPCRLKIDDKIGIVEGKVSYVGEGMMSHYIVETAKHGRFAVSRGHVDILPPK